MSKYRAVDFPTVEDHDKARIDGLENQITADYARIAALEARCRELEAQSTEERRLYEEAFDAMLKEQDRCRQLESALRDCLARWDYFIMPTEKEPPVFDMEEFRSLLANQLTDINGKPASAENVSAAHPSLAPDAVTGNEQNLFVFPAKCATCGKVTLLDKPVAGVFFCDYGCT